MKSLSINTTTANSNALMANKAKPKSKKLNFETANLSANDVALFLLEIAKKRKLINKKKKTFSSNATYSALYNSSELESILNETIAKVIKSFEAYINRCKGIKVEIPLFDEDEDEDFGVYQDRTDYDVNTVVAATKKANKKNNIPNISETLDLSSFGNLTGYFITAFNQNVSKDYKKNNGQKRKGDNISYDGIVDEDDKEAHNVFNQMQTLTIDDRDDKEEHVRIVKTFWRFLRAYDKDVNFSLNRRKVSPKKDKTSQLSYLFLYLVDPKYKGKFVNISPKFPGWSNYIYDKNLSSMVELLKQKFPDDIREFYKYIMAQETEFGTTIRPKMTKNYYDQSCSVTTTIEEKYSGSQVTVSVSIHLYRMDNGKNSILETETISETGILALKDEMKSNLKARAQKYIDSMKNKADQKRKKSLMEIYGY